MLSQNDAKIIQKMVFVAIKIERSKHDMNIVTKIMVKYIHTFVTPNAASGNHNRAITNN